MHKLTSNSSITYNAETQASGILTIEIVNFNYEAYNDVHNLSINAEVKSGSTSVASLYESFSEDTWNTFYAAQSLTGTDIFDQQIEAALLYIKQEIDTKWGLTSSDWTYSHS